MSVNVNCFATPAVRVHLAGSGIRAVQNLIWDLGGYRIEQGANLDRALLE